MNKVVEEKYFFSKSHFDRFMWFWNICEKINEKVKSGEYALLYQNEPTHELIKLKIDKSNTCVLIDYRILIGCEWDVRSGVDLIWIPPKKELKEIFKDLKVYKPESIKNVLKEFKLL